MGIAGTGTEILDELMPDIGHFANRTSNSFRSLAEKHEEFSGASILDLDRARSVLPCAPKHFKIYCDIYEKSLEKMRQ